MKKDKIIIGIAHDYIEFREELKGEKVQSIQLPIIYANFFLSKLKESGFCDWNNVKAHSYEAEYSVDCELWVQDLGSWKLKPVIETETVIQEIQSEKIN